MKRAIAVFTAVLMTILMLTAALPVAAASDMIIIDETRAVLVPENPTDLENSAVEILNDGLSRVFGSPLQTVTEKTGRFIALGGAGRADIEGLDENGYRIQVIDGNVHINGRGRLGLKRGVCRFLEEFCGQKVYTSKITVVPPADKIEIPADTDIVYNPFFEYSETDGISQKDAGYSCFNGLTTGAVNYLGGFCHTMWTLCETGANTADHPEQLALHDGVRTTDQPCLTEPEVLRIATKNVMALLERGHDPQAPLQIISVTQNDNMNYCECERCRAFEKAHGGVQSATMLNFANQIADTVKEAGYDNVAIDTFAYQYTRKPPVGIVPRDNVIVRLCTIECCFTHKLDYPLCKDNAELIKDLKAWSAICDRLYVWDYGNNFWNTCVPYPNFDVIQRNIQIFYENNVRGVYVETNYYVENCDAEFGELRAYMISKCLQNPYCDLDKEVEGFLNAYYGPAGKPIGKIIDMLVSHGPSSFLWHLSIGENPWLCFLFTPRALEKMDSLWAQAEKKAETPEQLERVKRSELSWRFWKACVARGEFSVLNPERFEEKEKLFNDLQAFGVKQLDEFNYGDYLDCSCIKYAGANKWNDYEEGEEDSVRLQKFGSFCEKYLVPILFAYGLYYKIIRAVSGIGLG